MKDKAMKGESVNNEMANDMIDRILAHEDDLIPSSGFAASVMQQIRDEAMAPLPISFPWKRAIPGFVFAAAGLGWGVFEFVRYGLPAIESTEPVTVHLPGALMNSTQATPWIALALGVWFASWMATRSLIRDKRLL